MNKMPRREREPFWKDLPPLERARKLGRWERAIRVSARDRSRSEAWRQRELRFAAELALERQINLALLKTPTERHEATR